MNDEDREANGFRDLEGPFTFGEHLVGCALLAAGVWFAVILFWNALTPTWRPVA